MRFYDRQDELARLEAISDQALRGGGRLTVITGRRRVGKTALIERHLAGRADGLYLFVGRRHPALLAEEFARVVAERLPELAGSRFDRPSDLVRALLVRAQREPLVVALDEIQNFLGVDPGFFSDLQAAWDSLHRAARCHLVVAGSAHTLMRSIFEGRKEPLFGRVTDRLVIDPLVPSVLAEILRDHGREGELLPFWAIFGGIPRYYELLDKHALFARPLPDILSDLVLDRSSVLYAEGRELLVEEFGRRHEVYFSVLSAVARGHTQMSRIADAAGIAVTAAGKYLSELQHRYRLVERRTPLLETDSRRGAYFLRDRFLTFWFRYVQRNASFLELGATRNVVRQVSEDLPNFLGPAFEALSREVLRERAGRGERPFGLDLEHLGGWWDRAGHEIDLTAIGGGTAVLAECKLSSARLGSETAARFRASCEAFARHHPKLRQRRFALVHERAGRARADPGLPVLTLRDLETA